jgi:hypothetical protein
MYLHHIYSVIKYKYIDVTDERAVDGEGPLNHLLPPSD